MKGMRRAEETGEVDGLYKTKKKNLDKTQHPLLHGVFSCFCCFVFFLFYFVAIIQYHLGQFLVYT